MSLCLCLCVAILYGYISVYHDSRWPPTFAFVTCRMVHKHFDARRHSIAMFVSIDIFKLQLAYRLQMLYYKLVGLKDLFIQVISITNQILATSCFL